MNRTTQNPLAFSKKRLKLGPKYLFFGLVLCLFTQVYGQTLKIGVVLSQTGTARQQGLAQLAVLNRLSQADSHNPLLQRLELIIRDDGSSPITAVEQAEDLINNDGVLALICCTMPQSSKAIAPFITAKPILTLSLSPVPQDLANSWLFSLLPTSEQILQAILLRMSRQGQHSLAVMTLDNVYGNELMQVLEPLLFDQKLELVESIRYAPNVSILTPEALWVATRQPETVLVWGLTADASLAYQALRARGYEREVILNPVLLEPGNNPDFSVLEGALFPVLPFQVSSELTEANASFAPLARFQLELNPQTATLSASAYAYDAFYLVMAALEQALVYGVSPDKPAFRSAIRDAFVTASGIPGTTGVYDFNDESSSGLDPYSVLMARVENGRLVVIP